MANEKKSLIDQRKRIGSDKPRFSTGIFALDLALGRALTRNSCHLLVGPESTGKTTIALKVVKSITDYDWETGEYGGKSKTLWIDMENAHDAEWAKLHGWDDRYNEIVYPEDGAEAADIITEALRSREYALIVPDSLDSFYPLAAIEKDASATLVGERAKLLSQGFIRWTSIMRSQSGQKLPTILAINQFRLQIGGPMYSDPNIIPGGKAQLFYSSTITRMHSPKVSDDCGVESSVVRLKGIIQKNKTAVPKKNFEFLMGLQQTDDLGPGEVANSKSVFDALKGTEIRKVNSRWTFLGEEYGTQKEIGERIKSDPAFYETCRLVALRSPETYHS